MCGRASLTKNAQELEKRFNSSFYSEDIERYNPIPNYNLAPGQFHPVITNSDTQHFSILRWGLIPFWAKDEKIAYKLINARSETLDKTASFKGPLKNRRCLVPLDGFYEWEKRAKGISLPYRFVLKRNEVFSVAGLWETWKDPITNLELSTFSIITVKSNAIVGRVHSRMPAILFPGEENLWLDNSIDTHDLLQMLKPYPEDNMYGYPVSTKVNSVRNNDADLTKETAHPIFVQGTLF